MVLVKSAVVARAIIKTSSPMSGAFVKIILLLETTKS
jgi:hypothetical protein